MDTDSRRTPRLLGIAVTAVGFVTTGVYLALFWRRAVEGPALVIFTASMIILAYLVRAERRAYKRRRREASDGDR